MEFRYTVAEGVTYSVVSDLSPVRIRATDIRAVENDFCIVDGVEVVITSSPGSGVAIYSYISQ